MSTGDEPPNLSAIAPPKMVLSMSLQLSYGTAAETDFKPTGRNWPPIFVWSTQFVATVGLPQTALPVDLTHSSGRRPLFARPGDLRRGNGAAFEISGALLASG